MVTPAGEQRARAGEENPVFPTRAGRGRDYESRAVGRPDGLPLGGNLRLSPPTSRCQPEWRRLCDRLTLGESSPPVSA